MHSTSHSFFHVERESQPDFEDQYRANWHLNPKIPIQKTKEDFDAAEHVLAVCTVPPPSAIPWIHNENDDGSGWAGADAHLSSIKYWNIFCQRKDVNWSVKLQRGERFSSFLYSLSCLSIWPLLSSGHDAVTHCSRLSETQPLFKWLARDPRTTCIRLQYEPDLSLHSW